MIKIATRRVFLALLFVLAGMSPENVFAQLIPCPYNIDWETGDSTGWTAAYGGGPGSVPGGVVTGPVTNQPTTITTPVAGFSARTRIMNTTMGNDFYGGFPVVCPNGGNYSIKVGDSLITNGAAKVQFTFTVPATINNYSVNFWYAVVIQNPAGHDPNEMPRFTVSLKDANTGLPIKDGCYDLNFIAGGDLPGFQDNGAGVQYKPWTKHTLNMSGTAGKSVTVEVTTGDCSLGGHFGYGYFDVEDCGEFKIVLDADSCNLDRGGVYLQGPIGFMNYDWYDNNYDSLVAQGQYVSFQPLTLTPQVYHLVLTPYPSVSLCKDTVNTQPLANINIDRFDSTCMAANTAVVLDGHISGGAGPLTYLWSEAVAQGSLSCTACKIPTATPPTSNVYRVYVEDTMKCHKSEIYVMGVNADTMYALDDFVFCRPGYTQLDANAVGIAPLVPLDCGKSLQPPCASTQTLEVQTLHRDQFQFKEDTTRVNNPYAAQYTSAHMQFILRKEDLRASGLRHGTLNSLGFNVYKSSPANFSTFKIALGCTDQSTLGGTFIPNVTPVYSAPAATGTVDGWNDYTFDDPYDWNADKNLVVDVCVAGPSSNVAPIMIYTNSGANDAVMEFTTKINGNVCLNGKIDDQDQFSGHPTVRLGYCKSQDAPFQYTWSPGTYLEDSTIKSPFAYLNKSIKYFVETIGGSECRLVDSVNITVPVHDYDIYPRDTSVCFGQKYRIDALGSTLTSVEWYEVDPANGNFIVPNTLSCEGCEDPNKAFSPIAKPSKTTTYGAIYKDQYGCLDTFFSRGVIRPLPNVQILNHDTTVKYGQSIQLLASGAYLYSWNPLGAITNPNLSNPHVAPTEPTTFYVWGLAEDGCRNIDSVKINIDYRDNLFVPTAFSPNGDGKNDEFRISNITFQKLQEFRVFNRWGQEIFSTTDPKKGWNGSWKGVPQDMGVYQYHIRVAYPDGFIETYKGNVTLVR